MLKEDIINALRMELPHLQRTYGLQKIGLFGSYVQGKQLEESDLDFIIEIDEPLAKNYFGLWTYLEKRFGKKIDLVRKGDHIGSNFMRTIERDIIYV